MPESLGKRVSKPNPRYADSETNSDDSAVRGSARIRQLSQDGTAVPGKDITNEKCDTPTSVEKDISDSNSDVQTSVLVGAQGGIENKNVSEITSVNAAQDVAGGAEGSEANGTVPHSNVQKKSTSLDDIEPTTTNGNPANTLDAMAKALLDATNAEVSVRTKIVAKPGEIKEASNPPPSSVAPERIAQFLNRARNTTSVTTNIDCKDKEEGSPLKDEDIIGALDIIFDAITNLNGQVGALQESDTLMKETCGKHITNSNHAFNALFSVLERKKAREIHDNEYLHSNNPIIGNGLLYRGDREAAKLNSWNTKNLGNERKPLEDFPPLSGPSAAAATAAAAAPATTTTTTTTVATNASEPNSFANAVQRSAGTTVVDHSEHGTEPSTAQLSPEELERKIMIAAQELMRKKMDKERREKNIIIKGLIETDSEGDWRLIQDLFADLGCHRRLREIVDIQRLGNIRQGRRRCRLVKIVFKSASAAFEIVSKAPRLEYDNYWGAVYIQNDLSREEREIAFADRENKRRPAIGDQPSRDSLREGSRGAVGGGSQGNGAGPRRSNTNTADVNSRQNALGNNADANSRQNALANGPRNPQSALNPGHVNNSQPNQGRTEPNTGNGTQPVSDNGNQTAPNSSGAGDIPAGDNNREINTSQGNANEEIAPSTGQEGTNSGTQPSGNGGVEGGQEGV